MAEEKHPSQSPEVAEQNLNLAQRLLWRIIARMVRVIDEKYGDEGLTTIYEGLRDWDFWQVPIRKAGLTPGQTSLEDLIFKVLEPGDKLLFSMQEPPLIEQLSEDKWLYKVRHCNVADVLMRESWKACPIVSKSIEVGVAKAANPNIKLTGDKFLVTGEDGCYTYYEMTKPPES